MGTDLEVVKPKRGGRRGLSEDKRNMLTEAAAIAYVQMAHGDYKYPDGSRRGIKRGEGDERINKTEVMRRAGYSYTICDNFDDHLGKSEYFWKMVEHYERRYTDPLFHKGNENRVWEAIGNEALRNLYERITYSAHSLSITEIARILKLVLDAGLISAKIGQEKESRIDKILLSVDDKDKREKIINNYIASLEKLKDD